MTPEHLEDAWRWTPHTFAQRVSGGLFTVQPHIRFIGNKIAAAIAQGGKRLMIHAPPRHGKSWLTSYWLPTWYLETFPSQRVILGAYGAEISEEWGRRVRNEFSSNAMLTTKLRDDSKAAGRWNTPQGGGMMAVGVGGALSGFGGNLIILDDLIKNWQDAHSKTVRDHLYDWWKSTLYTRAEPGATIVIAMTRWTAEDLPATLRNEHPEDWEVINLPALAEDNDPMGRAKGEPLCPARYDADALKKIMIDVGAPVWHALYQQRPDPFGAGRLFSRFSAANISDKVTLRADHPLAISLDFNINPGNHAIIGQYDNKRDQFTVTDEFYGPRMDIRTLMNRFGDWLSLRGASFGFPELHVYGDATGESEWAGTSESLYDLVRAALKQMRLPYKVRHLTKNPPLRESIDATNEAFRDVEDKTHVLIHPRCVGLIKDLQNQQSDVNGLIDKKDDAIGHYSDTFRYWTHYMRPLYVRGTQKAGVVGGVPQP